MLLVDRVVTGVARGGASVSVGPLADNVVHEGINRGALLLVESGRKVASRVVERVFGEVASVSRDSYGQDGGEAERFHLFQL